MPLMKKLTIYNSKDLGQVPTKVKGLQTRDTWRPNTHQQENCAVGGMISSGNHGWMYMPVTWQTRRVVREFDVIKDRWLNLHRKRGMTNTMAHFIHVGKYTKAPLWLAGQHWSVNNRPISEAGAETRAWECTVHCGRCHRGAIKETEMMMSRGSKRGVHWREGNEKGNDTTTF